MKERAEIHLDRYMQLIIFPMKSHVTLLCLFCPFLIFIQVLNRFVFQQCNGQEDRFQGKWKWALLTGTFLVVNRQKALL